MARLKLGLQLGYWGSGPPPNAAELVVEAERLGYDSVWTAEAYGSDALTPLAWWGSRTTEGPPRAPPLCQLSARTPTAMAMAALTLDHLSGGRFVLGLGVSGPQVVEGWYGQPFPKPLARTREYVYIVRQVLAREAPVDQRRPALPAALSGRHGTGQAAQAHRRTRCAPTSRSSSGPRARRTSPWRRRSPTAGSRSSSPPTTWASSTTSLDEGFARPGARRSADGLRGASPSARSSSTTTSSAAADLYRPMLALYIGGMGAKEMNFHFDVFVRMGFEAEAHKIQDALPRRPQGRCRRGRAHVDGGEDRAHRPRPEDPRRPGGLAGVASPPPCSWRAAPTRCA